MSFTSLINLRNCQVKRKTDVVLEKKTITLNPIKTRDPPTGQPGCMEVHISGYPSGPLAGGNGSVTIYGKDINGNAILGGAGECIGEFTRIGNWHSFNPNQPI
ncbi:unnamed protein product [marine sediment metagenome]|uniref:Uncharacterized protein n=1 Tax=marine sediment metagenome TaxID=412755 RepID=X1LVY6_9ZZZZ